MLVLLSLIMLGDTCIFFLLFISFKFIKSVFSTDVIVLAKASVEITKLTFARYDWKMDLRTYHLHVTNKCPVNHRMPEFVPMVYDYDNNTRVNISSGVRYILGFNEPDQKVQADLTPQEAADAWQDIEKHSHGKPLVSPSMAHHNFVWYDEFFRLCNSCRIDYLSAHAYGCNANHVMSYLEKLYQRYGKKIWLTEFACPKSSDEHQQLHLMQTLLPRLEAAEYIFR